MSVAAVTRRKVIAARLHERASVGRQRVDRSAGIIYGVKIVGRSSPNTHGVRGVDGTDYTYEALSQAAPLYEGINCNVDHPPRQRPDQERSAFDRFAWLENVEVREAGLFGDLHFLDPADPLAVKMLNAAESKPDAYALSHNAMGKGEVRGRRYVVTEIPEVRSVDIVADGGTNRSLFEGRAMQVKVCEVLRDKVLPALRAGRKKRLKSLLEGPLVDGRSPLMEAEDGDKDHRDHMYSAMRACEEAGNDEAATGIHKLLNPAKRVEEDDESAEEGEGENEEKKDKEEEEEGGQKDERAEMEGEGEEGPGEGGSHNEGPTGKGGPGTAWESRRPKRSDGMTRITEGRAIQLCKSASVECTADVMEAMKGADLDQALRILNLAKKGQAPARQTSAPRSVSRHSIMESQAVPAAADSKGWANRLLN